MAEQFIGFKWRVEGPYSCVSGASGQRVLVGHHTTSREYSPLTEEPALFLRFARMKPDEVSIVRFANEFGRLSHWNLTAGEVHPKDSLSPQNDEAVELPSSAEVDRVINGENLGDWLVEINTMCFLVELWNHLRDPLRNRFNLQQFLRKISGGWCFWHEHPNIPVMPHKLIVGIGDDPQQAAWSALTHSISELLCNVSPVLDYDTKVMRPRLQLRPPNLLAALWLQFARAIDGNRSFRVCRHCHNAFEFRSPAGGRSDKQFCSDLCRSRCWRESRKSKGTK